MSTCNLGFSPISMALDFEYMIQICILQFQAEFEVSC